MGVDISDLLPPHLNPPPPWREEIIFDSIGVLFPSPFKGEARACPVLDTGRGMGYFPEQCGMVPHLLEELLTNGVEYHFVIFR